MPTKRPEKPKSLSRELFSFGRREISIALFLSMFINMLALTVPLYMLQIFTHVLTSNSQETLVLITLMALVALAAWGALSNFRLRILSCLGEKFDLLIGQRIQKAMIARATKSNDVRTASALKDLATLRNAIGGRQAATLLDVPWAPLFIFVTFLLSPILGVIAVVGCMLLAVIAWANDRYTKEPQKDAAASAESELAFSLSTVRNAEVVEGMGMRSNVVDRWLKQHLTSLGHQARANDRGMTLADVSSSARMMLQVIIMGAGAYLVINNELAAGAMIASVYLLNRGLAPIEGAIQSWRHLAAARAAYNRLDSLLGTESQRPSGLTLPKPEGRLAIQNVVFGRPGLPPVLKGVSFAVGPGEIVGMVGPSAAGKSTLLKLIVGIWKANAGTVRLDGADVANWDPDDLGRYVGYLPQEVELFSGTVHENISRFSESSDEDIIAAAKLAGVHELILKLPKGYDTEIGDSGSVLSGGQRQRIALARAVFGGPRLIVLDEPNAGLDGAGEEALIAGLKRAKESGATVVIVTHKPSLLFAADKIVVLNEGLVDAFGERNEVLPKILPRPRRLVSTDEAKADQSAKAEAS